MANINDFKLINIKSLNRFNLIKDVKSHDLNEKTKQRLGFYHLVFEGVTGILDEEDSRYCIIDNEYNQKVHGVTTDDYGIDIVFISDLDEDEDENHEVDIKLFNYKFRENFNPDRTKTECDISISTKFLQYINSQEKLDETENEKVRSQINQIIDLMSDKICKLTLYMVSNEAKGFTPQTSEYIEKLEKNYGMEVVNISLDDIVSFFNIKKEEYSSKFLVDSGDFLSFESDIRATKKSYIIKLSLFELIRITSNDETITNEIHYSDDVTIKDTKLDFSLLFDNVRGFLGGTKYNDNILNTLQVRHKDFFSFNNGITITAEDIESEEKNSGMKYLFRIKNFQIVNGGQTIRTVYKFLNECKNEEILKLREAYILVRIFKVIKDDELKNLIAEYTNSQNTISEIDLKSIDPLQIQIESYLGELGILYSRKAGDLGEIGKNYTSSVSMVKLAQMLYSKQGYPDRATNQRRKLFQNYYEKIFKSDESSFLETCKELVDLSEIIFDGYDADKNDYIYSVQKLLYIIFITTFTNLSVDLAIDELEVLIENYDPGKETSAARKLIRKGFKEYVMEQLKIDIN